VSVALLLQLADGRFPAGGHAHSNGTEAACAIGDVIDTSSLAEYVRGRLATSGRVDASFAAWACAAALRRAGVSEWSDADAELAARTLSPSLRKASRTLGRQMIRAGERVWPSTVYADVRAASPTGAWQPIALGVVAAAAALSTTDAAICALHHALTGITSAGVRLLGLDPFDVARVNASCAPQITAIAHEAAALAEGPVAALPADVGLLLDVLAEDHARWDVRLFSS